MTTNYTYEEAFHELQLIVSDIESGQINIDALTTKIQRAAALIAICKAKLSASEVEVEKLLAKLHAADESALDPSEEEE